MKGLKRLLSLVAAGAMAFSVLGSTTAYAATTITSKEATITKEGNSWYGDKISVDIEAGENGYTFRTVYVYEKGKDVYYYYEDLFRHATYEMSNHMITADGSTPMQTSLFVLADASKDYDFTPDGTYSYGQSNYDVLYCCDIDTSILDETYYKRVNLEDSNYYDEEAAAHIRGILTNAYPYVTVEEMKQYLADNGYEYAQDLTRAEMLAAVQAAIWTYANNISGEENKSSFEYLKTFSVTKNTQWGGALHDFTNETKKAWTNTEVAFPKNWREVAIDDGVGERINSLIEFLVAQKAVYTKKNEIIISDIQIVDSTPIRSGEENEEDIYNVALKVALNNSGSTKDDNIELDVYVDDILATESTNIELGTEEYIINVKAKMGQTIKAVVSGKQYVPKGVYFYEPEGGRDASQCLVGVAEGETDVYAEASIAIQERILQFHKKTEVDKVQYPLEGIEFEIYYVSSVEDYNEDLSEILSNTDETDDNKYEEPTLDLVRGQEPIATVITDASGNAFYNLTQNNKPDGIYLIVEKPHDAIAKTLDPFLIAVPMVDKDGYPVYNLNLNLKNDVVRPEVDKDVTEIEQKKDTLNVGEDVTWIIRGDIPADIAQAKYYKLTDKLDYRLTYTGDLVVKVEEITAEADNSAEGENVLSEKEDYILTVSDGNADVNPDEAVEELEEIKTIAVELTKDGRAKIASMVGTDSAKYELRVYFNTYIDEDAEMGENIPNTVNLEYKNSANFAWNVEPEENPVVYTCGINLYKYDTKNFDQALAGAVFKLAKEVDQATEGATPLVTKEGTIYVVYEEFYTATDAENGELTGKTNTVTTTSDGRAMLYGLEKGTYYLVEIQAPSGYNLLSYPVVVTLNDTSHSDDNIVKVANSNQFRLPETGGIGTTIFIVSGMVMLAAAVVILVMKKKKEEE